MKRVILLAALYIFSAKGYCQCIDNQKISYGGIRAFPEYQYLCPTYNFVYNGDTSKHWSFINDIDIKQIAKEINPIKAHVEQQIKKYAGPAFYLRVKFSCVTVVYPDSIKQYIEGGHDSTTMKYCKAKYCFSYFFTIDTNVSYIIDIAVNEKGRILSKMHIPSESQYISVAKNMTVCKAISIARKISKNIDPIRDVTFDYDEKKHRFYWLISQEIINPKEGINKVNQVYIDAANPKIARNQIFDSMVVF